MNMRNLRKFSIAALAAAMLALGLTGCEKDPVKEATPEVINQLGQQAFELITRQRSKCYIYIQKMDQPSPLVINASKWPVKIHGYKTDTPNEFGIPLEFTPDGANLSFLFGKDDLAALKAMADAGYLTLTTKEEQLPDGRVSAEWTFSKNQKSDDIMQKYQHVLSTGESEVCVVKPSFAGVDFDTKNIAPTVLNEKIYAMDIQVKSQLDLLPYVKPDNVFSKHYNYYSVHKDNPSTRVTVIFDGRQEEPKWVLFNDFAKSPEGKALGL